MILEEAINKLLRDVINLILAAPDYAIKAKQTGAPRPSDSYADVDFASDSSIGWEQFTHEDAGDDLNHTATGMRRIMVSCGFYRDLSVDNARRVRIGLVRESVQALFSQAGLGLIRRSEVREISTALENGWEERAQFDVWLSAVGVDTDLVRAINTIDMACEFHTRGLVYNLTIEDN